ncbi:MAG: hypothetical protein AB1630_05145 [bacterium]
MEILGICLIVISLIGAYLWKANGKLQKAMMEALVRIEDGQKEIAQMLFNQTKILEKIEAKIP